MEIDASNVCPVRRILQSISVFATPTRCSQPLLSNYAFATTVFLPIVGNETPSLGNARLPVCEPLSRSDLDVEPFEKGRSHGVVTGRGSLSQVA